MSKRIVLSDREMRIIEATFLFVLKDEKYHIENSLVGKLGREEMKAFLKRLGFIEKVADDSPAPSTA